MTSRQDEQRCRCAYNTSLDTAREATTADDRKTAACVPPPPPPSTTTVTCGTTAPAAQQVVGRAVVDPCGRSPRPRGAGCGEKPHPADRTDGCGKPKSRCDDDEGRCENARPCGGCPSERDGCGGLWTCDANVCVRLDDGCGGFDLTPYGQQFAICTDRVTKKCTCVKFNGLQDSCKHPGCCVRRGCEDKPFPTCPPARKWRFDNVCCRDKMKKQCKPDCN